ncbi:hypothetical protein LCGC14_1912460, partial [marine sediment metagenome]
MSNYIRLKDLIQTTNEEVGPNWKQSQCAAREAEFFSTRQLGQEQLKGPGDKSGHGVAKDGAIAQPDTGQGAADAGPQSTSAPVQPAAPPKGGEPNKKEDEFTQDIADLEGGVALKPKSRLGAAIVKAFDQPIDTGEEEKDGEEGEEGKSKLGEFVRPNFTRDRYERLAKKFYKKTGMMAPGKDAPAAMGGPDPRTREKAWNEFLKGLGYAIKEGEFTLGKNTSKFRSKNRGTGVPPTKGAPNTVGPQKGAPNTVGWKKGGKRMSSRLGKEAVGQWSNPVFGKNRFEELAKEFYKKTGITPPNKDLKAWKKFLESKGYRIVEAFGPMKKDVPVYAKDREKILGYVNQGTTSVGASKVAGAAVGNERVNGKMSWVVKENNLQKEGVTGPTLMQVRNRAVALIGGSPTRMALEKQLRKEFPSVEKGVLDQAMSDAQKGKRTGALEETDPWLLGPVNSDLWKEVKAYLRRHVLPEDYKGDEEVVTDDSGNPLDVDEDEFRTAQKTEPTDVQQMDEPFNVETKEGPAKGEAGDYLAKGVDGEMWPIDQEIFDKTHEFVDETKGLAAPDFETEVELDELGAGFAMRSGAADKAQRDPFFKHQLKIARDTLKMSPAMANVMGGMSHSEARAFLKRYGLREAGESMQKTSGRKSYGAPGEKRSKGTGRKARRASKKRERQRGKKQAKQEGSEMMWFRNPGAKGPRNQHTDIPYDPAMDHPELKEGSVKQVRQDLL